MRYPIGVFVCLILGFSNLSVAQTTSPPSLTGETLTASTIIFGGGQITIDSFECDGISLKSIAYSATGLAAGAYPGTFTETGSGTFEPNPPATAKTFSATFTITSPVGTVTGTRTLSPLHLFSGGCSTDKGQPFPFAGGLLVYEAQIVSPLGTTVDHGVSNTSITRVSSGSESEASFWTFFASRSVTARLTDLETLVDSLGLPRGTANSLLAKLSAAKASLIKGTPAGCNQLQAFINEVEAQTGNALTSAQARALVTAAQELQTLAECP